MANIKRCFVFVACLISFIFYCFSSVHNKWLRNEISIKNKTDTVYIGLWRICSSLRIDNSTVHYRDKECLDFDEQNILELNKLQGWFIALRIFVIGTTTLMGQIAIFTAVIVFGTNRPICFVTSIPLIISLSSGCITMILLICGLSSYDVIKNFHVSTSTFILISGLLTNTCGLLVAFGDKSSQVGSIISTQEKFTDL